METQLKLAMMNDELGQARTSKKEFLDKINYSLYLCRPIYIVMRIGKA